VTGEPHMDCPECGEDAVRRQAAGFVPREAHGLATPAWAHIDGTSLCPVIGPSGYEPAQPRARLGAPAANVAEPTAPEPVEHLQPEHGEDVARDAGP
jgi:hypothetical protein